MSKTTLEAFNDFNTPLRNMYYAINDEFSFLVKFIDFIYERPLLFYGILSHSALYVLGSIIATFLN